MFLPAGDTALTRRARKHSRLAAVVLKWSVARKRNERQGVLVESAAIEQAEHECEADAEQRQARRVQAAQRQAELDENYTTQFAAHVRHYYPQCPPGREQVIAEHACRKYSGRIGRSRAAKALDESAIRLEVVAHLRHSETSYDDLLVKGYDRQAARAQVKSQVAAVLRTWESEMSTTSATE